MSNMIGGNIILINDKMQFVICQADGEIIFDEEMSNAFFSRFKNI